VIWDFASQRQARERLGQRLRQAREAADLTLKEAAAVRGRGHGWLVAIELGRAGIDALNLAALATLYGYPTDYFLVPDYNPVDRWRPRSRGDFEAIYGDQPGLPGLMFAAYDAYQRLAVTPSTGKPNRELT
jgi:transcriptional regulator with XRE-family HTH domain